MNLFDRYSGAFQVPVDKKSCDQLKADKWKSCHLYEIPNCTMDMELNELEMIYESHQSCHEFRVLENCSNCFHMTDHGHKMAQLIEYKKMNDCLQLIQQKKSIQIPNQQNPQIPQIQIPQIQNVLPQIQVSKSKRKKTTPFYLIILIILSIVMVSVFLIYVM